MAHAAVRLGLAALSLLTLPACDSQFSPLYSGESLLTITGNVAIADERRDAFIVPALAFSAAKTGEVTIREVDVQGKFPSDFRLDVYQPPPPGAFFNATFQRSGEPLIAAGYVTAVTPDHPDTIRSATFRSSTHFACEPECDKPCGGKGCLFEREEYCVTDEPDEPCYVEDTYCPTPNSPIEECTVEPVGDGDPSLKESPWRDFAGFSQNYIVLFLKSPAPAGSMTAAILGSAKQVPAGYGLYSIRGPTTAESVESARCYAEAEVRGAPDFNAEYGTELPSLNFAAGCGTAGPDGEITPPEFDAPFCSATPDTEAEVMAIVDARVRYIERAQAELGCQMREVILRRIEHPAKESVSVVIGPADPPALWPH
jgi:hypothetical protein